MDQSIPLCHRSKLFQTAHRYFKCKYFFVVYKTDMPQCIQSALIQIAGITLLCGTIRTKQMPLLHIQIKGGSIVHTAVTAAYDLRHKAAFTHCAQLKNGFDHPQICFALTDHIKAV